MTERQKEKAQKAILAGSYRESLKEKKIVEEYKPRKYPWRSDIAVLVLLALGCLAAFFLSGCVSVNSL